MAGLLLASMYVMRAVSTAKAALLRGIDAPECAALQTNVRLDAGACIVHPSLGLTGLVVTSSHSWSAQLVFVV